MKLRLIIAEGSHAGDIIRVREKQFLIGRHRECHLRPKSRKVSEHHCALLTREHRVFVRDFDSLNGTYLNNTRIFDEMELRDEDVLRIGPLVLIVWMEEEISDVVASAEEAGDSTLAKMLMDGADQSSFDGILGLSADSQCDDTIFEESPFDGAPSAKPESRRLTPSDQDLEEQADPKKTARYYLKKYRQRTGESEERTE